MRPTLLGILGLMGAPWMGACIVDNVDRGPREAARPPERAGEPTGSTRSRFYAINTLSLGYAERSGAPSPIAWKKYGYDIDGKLSNDKSTDHCRLKAGAAAKIKQDGEKGIDNSFGANILPILGKAAPDSVKSVNEGLRTGAFTLIFEITGLDYEEDQTNTGLGGQLFAGARLANPPKWDGNDDWPVLPELLVDGTIAGGSRIKFTDAYVNKGLFVSGTDATLRLGLSIGGVLLTLSIDKATLSFQKPASASGLDLTNGTIAGVLNTERLIRDLKKVTGRISDTFCKEGAFEPIAEASDIMTDGTNGDPTQECDGISIGIGFTARALGPPTRVATPPAPQPDPCVAPSDAGS